MTDRQKRQIEALRREGLSLTEIAEQLELSPNTVKSYCRRLQERQSTGDLCRNCGKPVIQTPNARHKDFCSNHCRQHWWNQNRERINHHDLRTIECAYCGQEFEAFGKRQRKYCSQACCAADKGG